jgi:hypothetical protein
MGRAVWMLLSSMVVLSACGPADAPSVRALVRDSAGVTIVENAAPLAADSVAFLIDSAPATEIGGSEDPRAEFSRISGVLLLPVGGIAVADGGSNELRLFDSAGAWVRTAGRKGGGPGEFEQLGGLFLLGGDSLVTYDWDQRRISVFTARGDLVREATLPQGGVDAGFLNVFGVLPDGGLLAMRQRFGGGSEQSGPRRDTIAVLRLTPQAVLADSIGRFPGSEMFLDVESSGGRIRSVMSTMLPFGLTLTMKVAGNALHVGAGDRYEIARYDGTGKLTRLIRRAHVPVSVVSADVEKFKRDHLAGFGAGHDVFRDRTSKVLDRMTFPATKPAYDGFIAGDDGALWVRRYDRPADDLPARYDVFDADGQWLGHVTFPARFTLHHAGPSYSLGVWRDPDDAEHVRLYRLRRAR